MTYRNWLASNITPLFLRAALAAAFLWAGWSKLWYEDPVVGAEAVRLTELGVIRGPAPAPTSPALPESAPSAPTSTPPAPPGSPGSPVPEGEQPGAKPAEKPTEKPTEKPADKQPADTTPAPSEKPATTPAEPEPSPEASSGALPMVSLVAAAAPSGGVKPPSADAPPATGAHAPPALSPEDFSNPTPVRRLYKIGLLLDKSANPEDPSKQLWPSQLASPFAIRAFAWAAAITEFVAGGLVLAGFLTRFASLALAGTMAAAMLLTTVGPAAVSGAGFLGFLPDPKLHDPAAWVPAWQTLLFQFTLLCASLGLAASGPGSLSLDRILFSGSAKKQPATAKV